MSRKLENLIISLTKSEKRYFRHTTEKLYGRTKYLQLFEHLTASDLSSADINIKNLRLEKSRLYYHILNSLRQYSKEKNIKLQINNLVQNVEITFEKELYKECLQLVRKGLDLCEKYQLHEYELILLPYQRELEEVFLIKYSKPDMVKKERTERNTRYIQNTDILKQEAMVYNLRDKAINSLRLRDKPAAQNIMKEITEFEKKMATNSFRSNFYLYIAKLLCHDTLSHSKDARQMGIELFDLMLNNSSMKEININYQILAHNNLASVELYHGDIDAALKPIEGMERILDETSLNRSTREYLKALYLDKRMLYHIVREEYERALYFFDQIKLSADDLSVKPKRFYFLIMAKRAFALFALEQYKECLRVIIDFEDIGTTLHPDDSSAIRVVRVLTYYYSDNLNGLTQLVQTKDTKLLAKREEHKPENATLNYFYEKMLGESNADKETKYRKMLEEYLKTIRRNSTEYLVYKYIIQSHLSSP